MIGVSFAVAETIRSGVSVLTAPIVTAAFRRDSKATYRLSKIATRSGLRAAAFCHWLVTKPSDRVRLDSS
jgi:hypothetical protein